MRRMTLYTHWMNEAASCCGDSTPVAMSSVRQLTMNRRFMLHRPAILFTLSTRQPEKFAGEPSFRMALIPVRRSLKVKCS